MLLQISVINQIHNSCVLLGKQGVLVYDADVSYIIIISTVYCVKDIAFLLLSVCRHY